MIVKDLAGRGDKIPQFIWPAEERSLNKMPEERIIFSRRAQAFNLDISDLLQDWEGVSVMSVSQGDLCYSKAQEVLGAKKYKPVARRVKPVPATLPEKYRIVRHRPYDPLDSLPRLPIKVPDIVPGKRFTQERIDELKLNQDGFLLPEEEKLARWIIKEHETAFAWDEKEKGRFSDEWFDPIHIPTLEHIPWVVRNIPIPPGMYAKVVEYLKNKVASGAYEPSNSSYRSKWFFVLKKDGKSLRLVHDLQPLNAITVKDSAVPPMVEHLASEFGGRACYGGLDLFVAFDQRPLAVESRDLTTFQSPIGALRLTSIPMGYTNSMQIMQGDVTHIFEQEIPEHTVPFIDDVPVKGPLTRYETSEGDYERLQENPGIRKFVWEHLNNMNRIIHRMKCAGGTFSGKKVEMCVPQLEVIGHICTYEGRIPSQDRIKKIQEWPTPQNLTDVRAFLGVCGVMRIFIKGFSSIARPLVNLTKKKQDFTWGEDQESAMKELKEAVVHSPALRPLDYSCGREIILAVDSSNIAVGYVLLQVGEDGKRYPNRFGSISWNEREARYSQPKIELYGLFRALKACRVFLIGLDTFTVEVDAKYIKGMLNNPDIQPNASINRWIAAILLFDFKLVHVPAEKHTGADGLSRREPTEEERLEDEEEAEDQEDWIDKALAFYTEAGLKLQSCDEAQGSIEIMTYGISEAENEEELPEWPESQKQENKMKEVRNFLKDLKLNSRGDLEASKQLIKYAGKFFIKEDTLWRRGKEGKHKIVLEKAKRHELIRQAHDEVGHKGIYTVRKRIGERFWWPCMDQDIKWFLKTCHECQVRRTRHFYLPPTVAKPFNLFRKVYIDTMNMPNAGGFKYIIHARCSLSGWPEWRMVRSENEKTIGAFVYENILCRWGALEEIVTDNGPAYRKAVAWLAEKYGIHHIKISPYNSRAAGVIERKHYDVREAIVKSCADSKIPWWQAAHSVFWAERVTIQKSTGYSPFYIVHGVEPLFPFDLAEATYLAPQIEEAQDTTDLITQRAIMLQKRPEDLEKVKEKIYKARKAAAKHWEQEHKNKIKDFNFTEGDLVLVRNSIIEKSLDKKTMPRYFGPMVVVRRTKGGSYILAEVDGSLSRLRYAAFRLHPYYIRHKVKINISHLRETSTSQLEELTHEDKEVNEFMEEEETE